MRFFILLILSLNITITAFSKNTNLAGYYIDNDGNRIEGEFKDFSWEFNPTEFLFKRNERAPYHQISIEQAKEFGLLDGHKYERFNNFSIGSTERNIFLKVLAEGDANLYSYKDENKERFFFKLNTNKLEELKYSKTMADGVEKEDKSFQTQLWQNLSSDNVNEKDFVKAEYTEESLQRIFGLYNGTETKLIQAGGSSTFNEKNTRIALTSGYYFGKVDLTESPRYFYGPEFPEFSNFRIGFEAELYIPLMGNHLAFFTSPTYLFATEVRGTSNTDEEAILNFSMVEIPIGLRYYLFFSDKVQLFANIAIAGDLTINSTLNMDRKYGGYPEKELKSMISGSVGLGFKYSNFSVETRIEPYRNIFRDHMSLGSNYSSYSIILGYDIFKK